MFIRIESNPNCEEVDGRVFNQTGEARAVAQVCRMHKGQEVWCDITGLDDRGQPCPAWSCKVDDSGEGSCYLIYGGAWGVRLQPVDQGLPWSVETPGQWGEAFLLLTPDGKDLRYA